MHRNYEFILNRLQNIATDVKLLQDHLKHCPAEETDIFSKCIAEGIVDELGTICDAAQFAGRLEKVSGTSWKVAS